MTLRGASCPRQLMVTNTTEPSTRPMTFFAVAPWRRWGESRRQRRRGWFSCDTKLRPVRKPQSAFSARGAQRSPCSLTASEWGYRFQTGRGLVSRISEARYVADFLKWPIHAVSHGHRVTRALLRSDTRARCGVKPEADNARDG